MKNKLVAAWVIALVGCAGLLAWALVEGLRKPPPPAPHVIKALFSPDNKWVFAQYAYYPDRGRKPRFNFRRPDRIWNTEQAREVTTEIPPINQGVAVFVGDSKHVLSANGAEGQKVALYLWEADTGRIIREFPDEDFVDIRRDGVNALAVSADGKVAVTGNRRGQLKVWDVSKGKHLKTIGQGYPVAMSADNKSLLSSSHDQVRLWDVTTGKELKSWFVPPLSTPQAVLADGTLLLYSTYGSSEHLLLWEFPSGKTIRQFIPKGSILGAMLTPDGKTLLYGCKSGLLVRENVATGKKIWSVQAADGIPGLTAVAFSQDGRLGFTGSPDGTVILWDVVGGTILRKLAERMEPP